MSLDLNQRKYETVPDQQESELNNISHKVSELRGESRWNGVINFH